jgi:hypothetical protein
VIQGSARIRRSGFLAGPSLSTAFTLARCPQGPALSDHHLTSALAAYRPSCILAHILPIPNKPITPRPPWRLCPSHYPPRARLLYTRPRRWHVTAVSSLRTSSPSYRPSFHSHCHVSSSSAISKASLFLHLHLSLHMAASLVIVHSVL